MNLKTDPELEKCLPPLDEKDYDKLRASLKKYGFYKTKPLTIWAGHNIVVDGHHRYKLCQEIGIEPIVEELPFESLDHAILYAKENQDASRTMDPAQKALLVVTTTELRKKLEERGRELQSLLSHTIPDSFRPAGQKQNEVMHTRTVLAKRAGCGEGTIERVAHIVDRGTPELQDMVRTKKLKPPSGYLFVKRVPDKNQQAEIAKGGAKAVNAYVAKMRAADRDAEKERNFQEEQTKARQELQEYKGVLQEQFGGAKFSCSLSSVTEMWCLTSDCRCAFDIFKPLMAKCCPACGGTNIEKREDGWYPGKKVV